MTTASDSKQPAPAVRGCLEACGRCRSLVEIVTGHDAARAAEAYRAIGPHLRHCLDHFRSFLDGLEAGVIDYDARTREARLEHDPQAFVEALDQVTDRLAAIAPVTGVRLAMRQEAASGGSRCRVETSIERELMFLSSHTIHHIAIMSLIAGGHGIDVPRDFGVAFSTATWENRAAVRQGG